MWLQARDYLAFIRMLLDGGKAEGGARVLGRAAVRAMTGGDRLARGDFAFRNLGEDRPAGDGAEADGWGLGFSHNDGVARPPPQLEAAPVFGWAGLHTLRFFGSHGERLAGVAMAQCSGLVRRGQQNWEPTLPLPLTGCLPGQGCRAGVLSDLGQPPLGFPSAVTSEPAHGASLGDLGPSHKRRCHGFDAFCRDRCDELHRGLRDVAHSMLP